MTTKAFFRGAQLGCLALGLAAMIFGAAGCGKNRVTVDVDVASFMDPNDLTREYQAPPVPVPVELELDPVPVNLVEGFQDFGQAEEVELTINLRYDNVSGRGDAEFTMFFDDESGTVFTTEAVATISANLLPNETTEATTRFRADARVLDLFTQKQMFLGVRFSWAPDLAVPQALEGQYTITAITAHVVSTIEIF